MHIKEGHGNVLLKIFFPFSWFFVLELGRCDWNFFFSFFLFAPWVDGLDGWV